MKLYNIRKDEVIDRDALAQEWGISPQQVVDFQALVGDSTDNVPGVPLIGPKFAQQLLEQVRHAGERAGTRRRGLRRASRKENLVRRTASRPC